jgi:UDP-N-acetylglucosamine diphosphorylase/glucosamine-1-phosphate N-acetyltransferase
VIIQSLSENQGVLYNGEVIAFFAKKNQESVDFETYDLIDFSEEVLKLEKLTDIFSMNHKAIELDFNLLTKNRESEPISSTNNIIGKENVFLEKGVVMEFVTINASEGPVYIGKDTLLMEGSLIRGPFSLGANSVLKMGAKIYGGTTIGPNCTVGGEVKNVVFFGNSNKGHDGYLGNSVVGEWCNFGADTNCSNMKNNHNDIKLWNYSKNRFVPSGFRFCGLFLGDYSKLGINSMLNTGTVIGVSVNSFGAKFPKKFIPSFSWAGEDNIVEYTFDKAIDAAKKMSGLKNKEFIEKDALILRHVFELSKRFR